MFLSIVIWFRKCVRFMCLNPSLLGPCYPYLQTAVVALVHVYLLAHRPVHGLPGLMRMLWEWGVLPGLEWGDSRVACGHQPSSLPTHRTWDSPGQQHSYSFHFQESHDYTTRDHGIWNTGIPSHERRSTIVSLVISEFSRPCLISRCIRLVQDPVCGLGWRAGYWAAYRHRGIQERGEYTGGQSCYGHLCLPSNHEPVILSKHQTTDRKASCHSS